MKLGSTCAAASYADGQGRTWSGRGPRPAWLREALANGKSLQDFASGAAPAPIRSGATTRSKGKAECETQIRYRDQAGNTWSGMGPQPRGLKEAVAAGTSLEQVAA
jgi:DNA-binding protein H-NS